MLTDQTPVVTSTDSVTASGEATYATATATLSLCLVPDQPGDVKITGMHDMSIVVNMNELLVALMTLRNQNKDP